MGLHSVTCHPAEVTFPPLWYGMVWYGVVNVNLYSAIITKVSNALNTAEAGTRLSDPKARHKAELP